MDTTTRLALTLDILRSNALYAIDQRGHYATLEDALDSAYGNARDGLVEAGLSAALEGGTFPLFRSYVQEAAAKFGVSLVGTCCEAA